MTPAASDLQLGGTAANLTPPNATDEAAKSANAVVCWAFLGLKTARDRCCCD